MSRYLKSTVSVLACLVIMCWPFGCDVKIPSGSVTIDGGGASTNGPEPGEDIPPPVPPVPPVPPRPGNHDPQAEVASFGRDVPPGMEVSLDATASSDPDGDAVFCNWQQVSGPVALEIEAAPGNSCQAYVVPTVEGVYQFTVTVTDGHGGADSATVEIWVHGPPAEGAPVADAGEDQQWCEGRHVTLRGGNSADPEGESLNFEWRQLSGPEVSLSGRFTAEPTFTAPQVDEDTDLVFELTVDDGRYWSKDTVVVTVEDCDESGDGDGGTTVERTYTTDEDFDEGQLAGVEHETVHDQLQLTEEPWTFPFIWIPNENETVSKIDTETGRELGRYYTGPPDFDGEPSRTTVDLHGNCWVGNRYAGSVIKIGLLENDQCVDRNGNGTMDTSRDLNDDGDITGDELLGWGQDECVLHEVIVIPGKEGTFVPGDYTGGYEHDWGYPGPRSLAVDADNNVWVGCLGTEKFYYLDGSTGETLQVIDVSPWDHGAYGAVIDSHGVVWSASNIWPGGDKVLSLDPSTNPPTIVRVEMGQFSYGLGLDYLGHLFASGWTSSSLSRVDTATMQKEWTQSKPELSEGRGVVCTRDNDVWVVSTANNTVYRYDNDGNPKASIPVGAQPTGVAVDAAGKVWACDLGDDNIHRIDPTTNAVELTKTVVGSGGHYTYSDMTGLVAKSITTRLGTWTVVFDSEHADAPWGTLSWNASEPTGTLVAVRVRSSENGTGGWSGWETSANGSLLGETLEGRYLQIEVTLQITEGESSPILYDLTVESEPIE